MSARTILHTLPDLRLGGGQLVLLGNVEHAERYRHVVCALRDGGDLGERFRAAGAEVVRLGAGGPASWPGAVRRLAALARDADIVHTNNTAIDRLLGQTAAARAHKPAVNTLHWALPARRRGGAGSMVERARDTIARRVARRCVRRFVAVSEIVRESWAGWVTSLGLPESAITTIHPGLDLTRFGVADETLEAVRTELSLGGRGPVLINVARLDPGKRQIDLLAMMPRVVERYPEAVLLIVGDGEERSKLGGVIAEAGLGGSIKLVGRRDDVPELLRLSDLFVFTSFSESFGLVITEAMAASLPVAAYALPAFEEIVVRGTTGELVDDKRPDALGEAVLGVLDDPSRARAMGAAGRARVEEKFEITRAVRALEGVYDDVLG